MDLTYSLRLGAKPKPMEQDEAAVEKLRYELFPSFCCGWVQATVSPWLLRQKSAADRRAEGGRQAVGNSSAQHSLVLEKLAQSRKQGKTKASRTWTCLP